MFKKISALCLAFLMLIVNAGAESIKDTIYNEIGKTPSEKENINGNEHLLIEAEAEYDFDASTKTLKKVYNVKGETLVIPEDIDGVPVEVIAPYAIDGAEISSIILPMALKEINGVIISNCPNLIFLNVHPLTKVTAKIYENCPLVNSQNNKYEELKYRESRMMDIYKWQGDKYIISGKKIDLPKSLLTKIGIFQGSDKGMDWGSELTRAQAAVILVRLLGMEEKAAEFSEKASTFSDVPDWAKGYVNLAYELGMVKGVGEGLFAPDNICSAQDFTLMLLRLTDLKEGSQYKWETSVADAQKLVYKSQEMKGVQNFDGENSFFTAVFNEPFTRELACALIYRILEIPTSDGVSSFADYLCRDYGFPVDVAAQCKVRLTPKALSNKYPELEGSENISLLNTMFLVANEDVKMQQAKENLDKAVNVASSVAEKAKEIIAGISSDYEKAKAVSMWIANNIYYDTETANGTAKRSQKAEDVLSSKLAMCDGYASLTRDMLTSLGIPCVYVFNRIKLSVPHAWNEVYIDGKWITIDNTYSSKLSYKDGEYSGKPVTNLEFFDMPYTEFYGARTMMDLPTEEFYDFFK